MSSETAFSPEAKNSSSDHFSELPVVDHIDAGAGLLLHDLGDGHAQPPGVLRGILRRLAPACELEQ